MDGIGLKAEAKIFITVLASIILNYSIFLLLFGLKAKIHWQFSKVLKGICVSFKCLTY